MATDPHRELTRRMLEELPPGAGAELGLEPSEVAAFVARRIARVDADDLAGRHPADLTADARSHLAFGARRPPGRHLVRVVDPAPLRPPAADRAGSGATGPATPRRARDDVSLIELVTDDRPFLVDSVGIALARHGMWIDLLVHPVELVRRDEQGRITAFGTGRPEAWIHAEVPRRPRHVLDDVVAEIRSSLDDLVAMHTDADAMREQARSAAAALAIEGDPRHADLLRWLVAGRFWFMGSHDAATGAASGIWRDAPVPVAVAAARPGAPRVVIEKDRARASILRDAHLERVVVHRSTPDGAAPLVFVGLFADSVWRSSVFDIPFLAARARAAITSSGLSLDSHAGRELVDTLEVFPRDELFAIEQAELERIVIAITKLQERRQVRLFSRRDGSGAFVSCLVYLPRDRFSSAVVAGVVDVLMDAYGGIDEQHDTRVTGRILSRIHVLVQVRDGATIDVDDDAVEARIAALTRWWIDDVDDALAARVGGSRPRCCATSPLGPSRRRTRTASLPTRRSRTCSTRWSSTPSNPSACTFVHLRAQPRPHRRAHRRASGAAR